jgi:hypothetical protein
LEPRPPLAAQAVEPVSPPAQTGLHEQGTASVRKARKTAADGQGKKPAIGMAERPKLAWQTGSWRANRRQALHYSQEGKAGHSERTWWWWGSRVRTRLRRSFPVSWERTGTFAEKAGTVPTLCPQFASHLRRLSSEFPRSRIRECGRQEHGPEHQEQGVRQHASGVPSASSYGADHVAPPPAVSSRERRNSPAGLQ